MEGGGKGRATKDALRKGMEAFLVELKEAARKKSWYWKLVCCGGRTEAFRAFRNEQTSAKYSVVVLLVDAEGPVTGEPSRHLNDRDNWSITEQERSRVHLMVQTMETWIVSDANALTKYYGSNFIASALPTSNNLEEVAKVDIARDLRRATTGTTKGEYHKIRHASDLLRKIDPEVVRKRCAFCERLFERLGQEVKAA